MHRAARIALGILLWVGSVGLVIELVARDRVGVEEGGRFTRGTMALILEHLAREEARLDVVLSVPAPLEVGDLVLARGRGVGRVEALLDERGSVLPAVYGEAVAARLCIDATTRSALRADAGARLVRVPQAFPWVVETLLTRENMVKIALLWNDTMLQHREEIFSRLTPIVQELLLDVERHVESELPAFAARHEREVAELKALLREELGSERMRELLSGEAWPAARDKLRPIVEAISTEIWERVPVWGLTWRFAYQSLPLTANDHVVKEWSEFLEKEAMPIFNARSAEIVDALRGGLRELLARESVQTALRDAFARVLSDPRFHTLAQSFVREVFLDNGPFQQLLLVRLRSPAAGEALAAATRHLEPMLRKMGDIVLGTRQAGITKEFARVLRSQILLKDLHRIELEPGTLDAPPLEPGARLEARVEWDLKEGRAPSRPSSAAADGSADQGGP